MKVNFYATYRQLVGGKTVDIPTAKSVTVRQLIDEVIRCYPRLRAELLDDGGQLYRHVHVFVSGRDAPYLVEGLDTTLAEDDTVNIFPPVAGGAH